MTMEEHFQDPATFSEVSVSVTEENEFPLDPSLLDLSGNNMQQYCTMLSLLEFQNIKPHMFLKTEHGEMLLSLATVIEEFEIGPWSYQGNESVPFDLPQQGSPGPQVRIQYNFVLHPEEAVLQENPSTCWTISRPEQGADLQRSENKSVASGENLSMFSHTQKDCPLEQRLMGDSNAALQQQEGFWQPNEMDLTAGQEDTGSDPEQDISGLDLLWANYLRTAGQCDDHGVGDDSVHQITHQEERSNSCKSSGESANEQPSSVVPERCPNCGRVFSLNGMSVTHQLPHTGEKLYRCPSCRHLVSCHTPGSTEDHQAALTDNWERLFCQLDLNHHRNPKEGGAKKCFHCPDCGKGFVHRSSIPRHQKLHRKENLLQNSGREKSCGPAGNQLCSPKAPARKKPLSCPDARSRSAGKERGQFATLCEVCGQSFSFASKFQKHLATHSQEKSFCCCHCGKAFRVKSVLVRHLLLHQPEKPFQCHYCDKGYIQKNHLNRHYQKHHGLYEQSGEEPVFSVGLPPANVTATI